MNEKHVSHTHDFLSAQFLIRKRIALQYFNIRNAYIPSTIAAQICQNCTVAG